MSQRSTVGSLVASDVSLESSGNSGKLGLAEGIRLLEVSSYGTSLGPLSLLCFLAALMGPILLHHSLPAVIDS